MPIKRTIPYTFGTSFITFTNYRWMNLFEESSAYDLIYQWYDYLKQQGNDIHGFVIMPNHVHSLISFHESSGNITKQIGNGKRFVAYGIVKKLQERGRSELLNLLASSVPENRKQKNHRHMIWESSFDWKHCYSQNFLWQKLNYIHPNPCRGKWNLFESQADYIHSSACFYITGECGRYPVMPVDMLNDISLVND